MLDIAMSFNGVQLSGDLALDNTDLATDEGLVTSIIIGLFSNARAGADDPLPAREEDRRGWWGDLLADVPGDEFGSKRWLYYREKATAETATKIASADRVALQFLIDQRDISLVTDISIVTEWRPGGVLYERIEVKRPDNDVDFSFLQSWGAA